MFINNINKLYNAGLKSLYNAGYVANSGVKAPLLSPLQADTVSFKGKNYDSSSIKKPTGHCAYCGAKVYSQKQLDAIAEELLRLKNSELEGKIRSILEKLGGTSDNALIRKKSEINSEKIEFFEKFRDCVSLSSAMSGQAILQKHFNLSREEAGSVLKSNLSPLLKTIDHVVPQRLDVDNDNTDLNLVESCFTCNSKIKNGDSFESFYYMYPSIKDNMPKEKFEFASVGLLEKSPHLIALKMTSEELLKVLDNLFSEENSIKSSLFAIQEKIKNCVHSMEMTVDKITSEREEKQEEISALEEAYKNCLEDEEFKVILERNNLTALIESVRSELDDLSSRLSRVSKNIQNTNEQIKEISSSKSGSSKKKKPRGDMPRQVSADDLNEKLKQLDEERINLSNQIAEKKSLLDNKLNSLKSLNAANPEIEVLKEQKNRLDYLVNIHTQINSLQKKSAEIDSSIENTKLKMSELQNSIDELSSSLISTDDITKEQHDEYDRYSELLSALKSMDENSQFNDKNLSFVFSVAKPQILKEIEALKNNPLVKNHSVQESINSLKADIVELKKHLQQYSTQKDSNRAQLARLISELDKYSQEEINLENNQDGSNCIKLKSFSLRDLTSRIDSLSAKYSQCTAEYEKLPELRKLSAQNSSKNIDEYNAKLEEIESLRAEISSDTSKQQKDYCRKKISQIESEIESLSFSDFNILSRENKRKYEYLTEYLEELNKGLEAARSPKERSAVAGKITSVSQELDELAQNDDEIFNSVLLSKKTKLEEQMSSLKADIDDLILQKERVILTLDKSDDISSGFSISEAKEKSEELAVIINRLSEKNSWLDIPVKIKKIQAEMKIQSENINSLKARIDSVKSSY